MCNFASRRINDGEQRRVSSYLDVEMTHEQCKLFNPSVLDTVLGYIMKDSQGDGARRRLPQQRLNIFCSNIQAYSCWLNSEKWMKNVSEAMQLSLVLADIQHDKLIEKEQRDKKRRRAEIEQLMQREERERQAEAKRVEGLERATCMMADIERLGVHIIRTFTCADLKKLIRYYFDSNDYKDENNKDKLKARMVEAAVNLYNSHKEQTEVQTEVSIPTAQL